jgi:hypothetical protein
MEEAIADALMEAGDLLAEGVRTALASQGLPHELSQSVLDDKVVITSNSAKVYLAERGGLSKPPSAPVETAVRHTTAEMLSLLQRRLQELLP